jgi:hypothetical protein
MMEIHQPLTNFLTLSFSHCLFQHIYKSKLASGNELGKKSLSEIRLNSVENEILDTLLEFWVLEKV